jgi:NADPH:quinone reductase-like Zn-dependent oxidoreductase
MHQQANIPGFMLEIRSEDETGRPIDMHLVSSRIPRPNPDQILVRILTAGVNY